MLSIAESDEMDIWNQITDMVDRYLKILKNFKGIWNDIHSAKTFGAQIDQRLDVFCTSAIEKFRQKYEAKYNIIGQCDVLSDKCSELIKLIQTTMLRDQDQLSEVMNIIESALQPKNLWVEAAQTLEKNLMLKLQSLLEQGSHIQVKIDGIQMDNTSKDG